MKRNPYVANPRRWPFSFSGSSLLATRHRPTLSNCLGGQRRHAVRAAAMPLAYRIHYAWISPLSVPPSAGHRGRVRPREVISIPSANTLRAAHSYSLHTFAIDSSTFPSTDSLCNLSLLFLLLFFSFALEKILSASSKLPRRGGKSWHFRGRKAKVRVTEDWIGNIPSAPQLGRVWNLEKISCQLITLLLTIKSETLLSRETCISFKLRVYAFEAKSIVMLREMARLFVDRGARFRKDLVSSKIEESNEINNCTNGSL